MKEQDNQKNNHKKLSGIKIFKLFPIIRLITFLFVLSSVFTISGCTKIKKHTVGEDSVDGFLLVEFEMKGIRFEPQGFSSSIKPARTFWLKSGDTVAPKWSNLEFHWEEEGEMCNFSVSSGNSSCLICDYCNPPASFDDPPCMGFDNPFFGRGALQIVSDEGFIKSEDPELVIAYERRENENSQEATRQLLGTCDNTNNSVSPFFQPQTSGIYRFVGNQFKFKFNGDTDGEIKIQIVEQGASLAQKTAYQLNQNRIAGTDYWTWEISGDSLWLENFSPNLRVTDIAVYKGICADASAQGKQCAVPNEKVPVKPSSIRFLPNFQDTVTGHPQESQHVCYNNSATSGNSFINLDSCSTTPSGSMSPKRVTPTYEVAPSFPLDKLTWIVEFNTNQGADADLNIPGNQPLSPNTELIIEFTIEAS